MSTGDNKFVAHRWQKGIASPNPGGRSKKITEIERMLDDSYRTLDEMRMTFATLKRLALEGESTLLTNAKGEIVGENVEHNPAYMKLWLDRLLGAVKPQRDDAQVEALATQLVEGMIAAVKQKNNK